VGNLRPESADHDGSTFDDALADLGAGRCLQLDVWHATAQGPCLSGSGAYGHSMAVAPERSGTRWLVADPWCSPARWTWWEESLLRAGAEKLGSQAYSAAAAGPRGVRNERELVERMRPALRVLMTLYRPDAPAVVDPPETEGSGGRIFYTTTTAQGSQEADDVSVNAAAGLVTNLRADVPAGLDFFGDANLTKRLGSMSKAASVYVVGDPISETVEGGSRAILVNTGTAYPDGSARPTIVYVAAGAIDPVSVPPPAAGGDVDEAITERDKQWRDWLLEGSPGTDSGK
jgi:hypothetical protein